jgi:uncharacterized protein
MKKLLIFMGVSFFSLGAMEIKTDTIFTAIEKKEYDVLKKIVAQNPNLLEIKDAKGTTPLTFAIERKDTKAARILLQAGAKPMGLMSAIVYNDADMVKLLLEYDVDMDVRDRVRKRTPLEFAKEKNNPEIIELLEDAQRKKEAQQIVQKRIEEYTQKNKPTIKTIESVKRQ